MEATLNSFVDDIAVSGFFSREGRQVFLVDVLLEGTCQQVLRRYADFVALQTALEELEPEEKNDTPLASLPSFKQLFPPVYKKDSSDVLVPELEILTNYCKALLKISGKLADESCLLNFFTPNEFDTQLKRRHIIKSQAQATFQAPQGRCFKVCMVLEDFYHASKFGPFESQAGEMVAYIGSDSDKWSLVGRCMDKMQLGWLPENYLIELPEDEDDPMMDNVHHFLLCVQMSQTTEKEDTFTCPKYTVTGRLPAEASVYDDLPSTVLDLKPGSLVTVIDKDEDGWWFVSGETGEGWFPSTLLKLTNTSVPLDKGELDEVYSKSDSDPKHTLDVFYTLRKYAAGNDDELSFDKGVPLEVLHRSTSGWWTVRCGGKVGLCPAVYLTRNVPVTKHSTSTPHRPTLTRSATHDASLSQARCQRPILQRSLTIYKPQPPDPAYTIGFNASNISEPPPRRSLVSDTAFEEATTSGNVSMAEDLLKMTPGKKLLQDVKRSLQKIPASMLQWKQVSQSSTDEEASPRTGASGSARKKRRIPSQVLVQEVHPLSLPGTPLLGRWPWLHGDSTEDEDVGKNIPRRFAGPENRQITSQLSFSKGSPLTGSLPGSPASKASSKDTIPLRFLQSPHQAKPSTLPAKQQPTTKSPIPRRFLNFKEPK